MQHFDIAFMDTKMSCHHTAFTSNHRICLLVKSFVLYQWTLYSVIQNIWQKSPANVRTYCTYVVRAMVLVLPCYCVDNKCVLLILYSKVTIIANAYSTKHCFSNIVGKCTCLTVYMVQSHFGILIPICVFISSHAFTWTNSYILRSLYRPNNFQGNWIVGILTS